MVQQLPSVHEVWIDQMDRLRYQLRANWSLSNGCRIDCDGESVHGTFRTRRDVRPKSVIRSRADVTNASRLIGSRLTNPHCPHCSCGAQGRPAAPWLRQNNPSGKFSLSPSGKSLLGLTSSCPRGRGVGHRHERWDGMRWTRQCRARDEIAGRASARERSQDVQTSGAEAYGEVVWS